MPRCEVPATCGSLHLNCEPTRQGVRNANSRLICFDLSRLAIGIGHSTYIVIDVHELIDEADRDLDDSWQFSDTSLSRIEFVRGLNFNGDGNTTYLTIRANRLYPDQYVQALARTIGQHVLVERALLGGKSHESVTSFLFTALRGDGLHQYAQQVLALGEQVRANGSEIRVIESNAPDVIPPHGTDRYVFEKTDYVRMCGGELRLERTEWVTYNSGNWPKIEILKHYRYSDYHVTISDDILLLAARSYRLDGVFI